MTTTQVSSPLIEDLLAKSFESRNCFISENPGMYRLFNSESDGMMGLKIDIYGSYAVCQFETMDTLAMKTAVADWLMQKLNLKGIYGKTINWRAKNNGIAPIKEVLAGDIPETISCQELGMDILVDPRMQKTGYFIDFREVRRHLEQQSRDLDILNCYSFTGSLGLFALRGGANHVTNVDINKEVLELGKKMLSHNGFSKSHATFIHSDARDFLVSAINDSARYDIIILDPPQLAALPEDAPNALEFYKEINTLGCQLLKDKTCFMYTSCCSHGVTYNEFRDVIEEIASTNPYRQGKITWEATVPEDHPAYDFAPHLNYLSMLGVSYP